MEFWQVYLAINLLAAVFIVWPTIFVAKRQKKDLRDNDQTESNVEVFHNHIHELEQTMVRGEIDKNELSLLKRDLEKTLVEENGMAGDDSDRPVVSSFKSRIPVLSLVFALPILSLALYSYLGSKQDWEIYQLAKERLEAPAEKSLLLTQEMIRTLQDRVAEKPANTQNWYLLASTAVEQGLFDEGVRAYRKLLELEPDAPAVKAELAQAIFLRAGNTITPEVKMHTQEALSVAPNMPTALGLAGIDAYQSGDYSTAVGYWQKALAQLDPASAAAQALSGGIARAQVAISKSGGTKASGKKEPAALSLKVKVSLDKSVVVDGNDAVFVYARAWQGPRMPLAIQKLKVSDLPASISLDQSMSMAQGMDLTSFPQVEVVARVSSTGSAISKPGDWQASFGPVIVASQSTPVVLKIDKQIPEK